MNYFSYDPEDGIEFHATEGEARDRAEKAKDDIENNAADSDWHWSDRADEVAWGMVLGKAQVEDRKLTPEEKAEDPEWEFHRTYTMEETGAVQEMVDRFLSWALPEDFTPDAGISFEPEFNVEYMESLGKPPMRHEPTGTNLFDAGQAEVMIRHAVGLSPQEVPGAPCGVCQEPLPAQWQYPDCPECLQILINKHESGGTNG